MGLCLSRCTSTTWFASTNYEELEWSISTCLSAAIQLVRAFILWRIDYCNNALLDLPGSQLNQPVLKLHCSCSGVLRKSLDGPAPLAPGPGTHHLEALLACIPSAIQTPLPWLSSLTGGKIDSEWTKITCQLRYNRRIQLLAPPRSKFLLRSEFRERSFTRWNPVLWTPLTGSVTRVHSAGLFILNLKTHLFNIANKWHVSKRSFVGLIVFYCAIKIVCK